MKNVVTRMAVLLVIGALTSVLAWSKTTEKQVTFNQALTVNGTLLKKGTYNVLFNEETGELTIKKGKKVVVTAQARLEQTDTSRFVYTHASGDPGKPGTLLSVYLREGSQATVLNGSDDKTISVRQ